MSEAIIIVLFGVIVGLVTANFKYSYDIAKEVSDMKRNIAELTGILKGKGEI